MVSTLETKNSVKLVWVTLNTKENEVVIPEACSEPCQTSKTDLFAKIVSGLKK